MATRPPYLEVSDEFQRVRGYVESVRDEVQNVPHVLNVRLQTLVPQLLNLRPYQTFTETYKTMLTIKMSVFISDHILVPYLTIHTHADILCLPMQSPCHIPNHVPQLTIYYAIPLPYNLPYHKMRPITF